MKRFDYDLVVIGGGAAGMVSSKLAKGLGKKAAIIESKKLGGSAVALKDILEKARAQAALKLQE